MNDAMKQIAIKYGTYLALLNISYILYAYLVDASVFTATWPVLYCSSWQLVSVFLQWENSSRVMRDLQRLKKHSLPISLPE